MQGSSFDWLILALLGKSVGGGGGKPTGQGRSRE
jgi:hypothetical protein